MRIDASHRSSAARWLLAGLAALALAAGPLLAQEPAQDPAQAPAPGPGGGYGYGPAAAGAYPAADSPGSYSDGTGSNDAYAGADAAAGADPYGDDASSVNDYPASAAQSQEGSYGYFHLVQGQATDAPARGDRAPAEVNQPVLAGDRIAVPRGSRVEIVLPDHNLLRLDGGTEIVLDHLAGSADSNDRETQLHLLAGNLQLVVDSDSLGEQLPRIDTANASVYVNYPGTYRVSANGGDWTSLVVRRGTADIATERGTATVRADQAAVAQGTSDAEAEVRPAGAWDTLERWGRQLSDQVAEIPNIDQDLQYSASSLGQYGSWIEVAGTRYWQPRVDNGWRPYWHGRWVYTPSGLTWVAYEPWGWVPYHYGTWDYLPAYGWVWAPGYVYSPAWVYWYWGPSYTGWCPVGYYTGFYRHHFLDPGFRFGVYGWAGGDWGSFARWNFVGAGYFGHRDLDHWVVPGDALRDRTRLARLPHGIITTDTRGITPGRWGHPREVISVLSNGPAGRGGRLPDVTPFIARSPRLPTNVLHAVVTDGPAKGRLTGTPLRPATLLPQPGSGYRAPRAVDGIASYPTGAGRNPIAPRVDRNGGIGRDLRSGVTGRPTITVPPRGVRPPAGRIQGDWRERADRERPAAPGRGAGPAKRRPARPAARPAADRDPAAPAGRPASAGHHAARRLPAAAALRSAVQPGCRAEYWATPGATPADAAARDLPSGAELRASRRAADPTAGRAAAPAATAGPAGTRPASARAPRIGPAPGPLTPAPLRRPAARGSYLFNNTRAITSRCISLVPS